MILHADGNSFYASCEQIYRPDLRGKPIAVLSNNDGIIIALNKEAKSFGIRRGDPYFKVRHICEANGIAIFSSNYTLYSDISRRITSIYLEYAPEVEEYSIDECFLFFDGCNWSEKEYEEIGYDLKKRISREVGIPICVGIAPTKTLAKLYNKNAKKNGGVFVYKQNEVDALLQKTPCDGIWGIGTAKSRTLFHHGIENALMLKQMPLNEAKKLLTIQGYSTVRELNGIRCIDRIIREKRDVITSSRQFSHKIYDIETIECAVIQYAELAVERLRQQDSECGAVHVHLSTCNYYSNEKDLQYSDGICMELPRRTSYTPDIVKAAQMGLRRIFRAGYGYKTVMITLVDLRPADYQGYLWSNPMEDVYKRNFMDAVDSLSSKYGRQAITLAKGLASDGWQMKREFLSPCWTTRITDIPKVK